ncbi:hypothetical protein HWV07_07585 [Natronomonas salina]|uniref:hypothetical protein n=1 Tax=Natronomonas salina TaxID=1710540 RepID=UPI0015B3C989|nr:hypothetical protein [Natronomonas salina]QLD88899.1 hypothetical protein HWV07_07585 [Natronomonas salina]
MVLDLALQLGIPGGPELLVIALVTVVPFVIAYWVYNHAESRGEENAALWAVVAGLASIVATPIGGMVVVAVYVWQRD